MSGPNEVRNEARDGTYVGAQAGVINGDVNNFTVHSDATPKERFEAGVRCLESGIASQAREYITFAIMREPKTPERVFFWLLSLVSGRSRNELSGEDIAAIEDARRRGLGQGQDHWAHGVTILHRLLAAIEEPEADDDIDVALNELDELDGRQRDLILRHTQAILHGPIRDEMWRRTLCTAQSDQHVNDRAGRFWKFFEPKPAGARVPFVWPAQILLVTWLQALAATAAAAVAIVYAGFLLAETGRFAQPLFMFLSLPCGVAGGRAIVDWRFRTVRRREKERIHRTPPQPTGSASPDGFAAGVTRLFDHYFARYVPSDLERAEWSVMTAGIRRHLRDEIVELYREQRTSVRMVAWLIRHLASTVRTDWQNRTLYAYRAALATPPRTKAIAIAGTAAFAVGVLWALAGAFVADPLHAAYVTFVFFPAGWVAARAWLTIGMERKRAVADEIENARELERREAAFERWTEKLRDRPVDGEMAGWLECDRKLLLDEALRHHRLPMSDVVAYTFLDAPGAQADRARQRGGPWRYTRYEILVFLLTRHGIRQLDVQLDAERGTIHDRRWTNYRYDALARVRVNQADDEGRTFELSLVDGNEVSVTVMPGVGGDDPDAVNASMATLEAAGISHTLHILEGVAAEGRGWLSRMAIPKEPPAPPDTASVPVGG